MCVGTAELKANTVWAAQEVDNLVRLVMRHMLFMNTEKPGCPGGLAWARGSSKVRVCHCVHVTQDAHTQLKCGRSVHLYTTLDGRWWST